MKILYITSRFPYPLLKGDQVVAYHRIKDLSKKHNIILLSFYERDEDLKGIKYMEQYCSSIYTVKLPKWQSLMNVGLNALFSNLPLQVLYYRSPMFKRCLKKIIAEQKIDLIHSYLIRNSEYLKDIQLPKIIDLIDSMQLNLGRRIILEPSIIKRIVFKEELRRIRNYECNIGEYFNHMFVVANEDKALINSDNVSVIPNGVDIEQFSPNKDINPVYTLIFSGNMGYEPNINAVMWFAENCFPILKKRYPNLQLCIAGGNPTSEVKKLAERYNGIEVTGFVESMPDTLNKAQIAVAPMQSGSGMQNKILEAMACSLPVVTTTLGLGSIKAQHEKELFIADGSEETIEAILRLIQDVHLRDYIGKNAREYVKKNHSWNHMADLVEQIYLKVR